LDGRFRLNEAKGYSLILISTAGSITSRRDEVGWWWHDPPCAASGRRRSRRFQLARQHTRSSSRVSNLVSYKIGCRLSYLQGCCLQDMWKDSISIRACHGLYPRGLLGFDSEYLRQIFYHLQTLLNSTRI
jgi:hypothetical protein